MAEGIKTSGFNRSKIKGWADLWAKAQKAFDSAHGTAMQKLKDAREDIRTAADQAGIKKSVWNKAMKRVELMAKAEGLRSFEEQDLADQYDSIISALRKEGVQVDDDAEEPPAKEAGSDAPTEEAAGEPGDEDDAEERRSAAVSEIAARAGARPN